MEHATDRAKGELPNPPTHVARLAESMDMSPITMMGMSSDIMTIMVVTLKAVGHSNRCPIGEIGDAAPTTEC